jgi:group I intron endonuclease
MHIYAITNEVNGKVYIGQHAGDDLGWYFRENTAAAMRGNNGKTLLYRAIRKHGTDAFTIRSLVRPVDKEQMDRLEIFFIRTLETQDSTVGYNITAGGGGVLGLKHSAETIENNRIKGLEIGISTKCREAQKEYLKTRIFTAEHRAKLAEAKKGKLASLETRLKQSLAKQGHVPWNKGLKNNPVLIEAQRKRREQEAKENLCQKL